MISKEQFNEVWKDSSRESILNQFYYEHNELINLQRRFDKVLKYFDENYFDFDDDRCKTMEELLTIDTPKENLYKYTPEKGFRLVGDKDVKD